MINNAKKSEVRYFMNVNGNMETTLLLSENLQLLYALQCKFIICYAVLRQLLNTAFDLLQVNCLMFKWIHPCTVHYWAMKGCSTVCLDIDLFLLCWCKAFSYTVSSQTPEIHNFLFRLDVHSRLLTADEILTTFTAYLCTVCGRVPTREWQWII